MRAQGKPAHDLVNQRIVCLGAGSAGLGVISSILDGMEEEGLSRAVWLVLVLSSLSTYHLHDDRKPTRGYGW